MAKVLWEKDLPQGRFMVFQSKPEQPMLEVQQTHSSEVLMAKDHGKEADGIIQFNSAEKVNLAIKTADCIPFLVLGREGYGMIHAGWRGIHGNIQDHELINKLQPQFFLLGPHASVNHYEVGPEFKENFPQSSAFEQREQQLYFNLAKELASRIKNSYPDAQIEISHACTIADKQFHSFRRDQTKQRNWNLFFPA